MGTARKSKSTKVKFEAETINFSAPHKTFTPKKAPSGPYSFSQLSLFERCPRKYWLEYIAKIKTPQTRPLILGSAIHNGVEAGIRRIVNEQPREIDPETWVEVADTQTPPNDCIKDYKKGLVAFSHWLPTIWQDRTLDPEIAPEWSFGLDRHWQPIGWTGDRHHKPHGLMLRGSIDLMVIHHLEGFAYIWDLKTGKNPYEVFSSPGLPHRQLAVYAWALFCFHPHLETVGTSFFNLMLKDAPDEGAIFDLDRAMEYGRNWVEKLVREIESRDYTKIDEWEPTENKYCAFCDFKLGCPVGKHIKKKRFVPKNWNKKQQVITDEAMEETLARLSDDLLEN